MAHMHYQCHITGNKCTGQLFLIFTATTALMLVEAIGGFVFGSLTLLADASHMFMDAIAILFSLLAIKFAHYPPNTKHTFGWLRLTTITAFINATTLVVITIFILWKAVESFYHALAISVSAMIAISTIGLVTNIIYLYILHRNKENNSLNIRVITLHIIGDLFSSIGTITSAIIIIYTGWISIDSILSVLISCLVLYNAWQLLRESVNELLEGAPPLVDIQDIKYNLRCNIQEICDIHHIHIWQIGNKPLMTLHVQTTDKTNNYDILLNRIQDFLKDQYQISHTTIQIERQICKGITCHMNQI